ncbi:hypothetical protein JNB_12349 [Janibacter sp. HTCC2649]|uniref:TIGR03084 family metal-binding protein n=1 Tax=Janibacter sp. HTCC2649 TaxID=313589 RepID=UPI0000670B28|nr:TIGR03084 family metal-binding protein [Janibacter sp. HTCC2649]EAQ00967.1 hypothetical protein JNB_12349 [Janibacter sp. HTCC2649]
MNARLEAVLTDLTAESEQLDAWIRGTAGENAWRLDTPAAGWTVAHQIAHLLWTDEASVLAITDPAAFGGLLRDAASRPDTFVDDGAAARATLAPDELLTRWRAGRMTLAGALRGCPDDMRIPWYGPPMAATSMATARMMETWAHAHDVAAALGVDVPRTDRARHVAFLGVRTRGFAHQIHGIVPPTEEFRVELTGPTGDVWAWGPEDAEQRVTGDGWDFALLVTRRLHRDDAALVVTGADAERWLGIAQAFAGPPGAGPQRRSAP